MINLSRDENIIDIIKLAEHFFKNKNLIGIKSMQFDDWSYSTHYISNGDKSYVILFQHKRIKDCELKITLAV